MPSKQVFFEILTLLLSFSPKTSQISPVVGESQPKSKGRVAFNAVEDRQKMSMEHEHELGITLSESVNGNFVRHPLEDIDDVIFDLQENFIISGTVYDRREIAMELN